MCVVWVCDSMVDRLRDHVTHMDIRLNYDGYRSVAMPRPSAYPAWYLIAPRIHRGLYE